MKQRIYEILNSIAETYYRQAPAENASFPVIVFYYILNEPLFQSDNTYSNERRIIFNVDVFHNVFVDELAKTVEMRLKNELKAVLRNEEEIDDGGIYGIRFEFEIQDLNK